MEIQSENKSETDLCELEANEVLYNINMSEYTSHLLLLAV